MSRFRNAFQNLCRLRFSLRRGKPAMRKTMTVRMAQITSAVHHRQIAGMTTTLRQLHLITELSQPEALNVVAELEFAGIAAIDRNISDAFESTVTLTEETQRQLGLAVDHKATSAAA